MNENTADSFKRTRRMILLRVLLAPFITLLLVFGTLVYYFATNLRSQEEAALVRIAEDHRGMIERFLGEKTAELEYVTTSNSFDGLLQDRQLAKVFERLQKRWRAFSDIGLFDSAGNHVVYVGPYDLEGKNYAQTAWFREVREHGVYISDVFLGYRNIPHFIIAVRRDEGDRVWYLRTTIDSFFFTDLVDNVRVGKTGEAYIVNGEGLFQTRRRSGGYPMETDPDHGSYIVAERAISSFAGADHQKDKYQYATGRIGSTGWTLVVRQSVGEAYAPLVRAVAIAIALFAVGGTIAVSTAFMLASGVVTQLRLADAEKRRMGTQLIMAGKLAEVGEMSAGVAHEINNPLQVIKGEEALMKDILEDMEKDGNVDQTENFRLLRESIDQIALQVDRGKHITKGLLGFARQSETRIEAVDLKTLIPGVVKMIENRAQLENIRIVQELEMDLPSFLSDPAQLQQVFLNLLNNAIDALREKGGGEIRVAASRVEGELRVSVGDNGCGISPENLEKIFQPFFTTKPVGQGTGLGLSTCIGIVEQLGGQIKVASEVDAGTVFTISFPLDESGKKAAGTSDRQHPEVRAQ